MQDHCSRSAVAGRVTVSREQRDVIHDELLTVLSGVGDVYVAVLRGDYEDARRLRRRYGDVMRLLDDLGWSPDDPGEEFAITMEPEPLTRLIAFLQVRSAELLATSADVQDEAGREAADGLSAIAAYGAVMTQLSATVGTERDHV